MIGIEMENTKTIEFKKASMDMFAEICDPTSLVNINLQEETLKAVITKFLSSKANKTDLGVLIGLMKFWDEQNSFLSVTSFNDFRLLTGVELANANLSRSLKSLEQNGFIERVGSKSELEYLFHTPFEVLRVEIGK